MCSRSRTRSARAIVDKLKVKLAGDGEAPLVKRPTRDLEAYHLYLQGRYAWQSRRDAEGLRRAIECFEQAIARDPAFAIAHAGLADVYSSMAMYELMAPREVFATGEVAAQRAVALDGELAEAHYALGLVRMYGDSDPTGRGKGLSNGYRAQPDAGGRARVFGHAPVGAGARVRGDDGSDQRPSARPGVPSRGLRRGERLSMCIGPRRHSTKRSERWRSTPGSAPHGCS